MANQIDINTYSFRGTCDIRDAAKMILICGEWGCSISKFIAQLIHFCPAVMNYEKQSYAKPDWIVDNVIKGIRERNKVKRARADKLTRDGKYRKIKAKCTSEVSNKRVKG